VQGFGIEQLLALLTFCTVMSFTPGPNTMLSSALAANYGLKRALPFISAVPIGWILLLWLCVAGVGVLVKTNLLFASLIKYGGIAYMIYLAWKLLNATAIVDRNGEPPVRFGHGVLLQFVNIKAWFGALTITGTWIASAPDLLSRTLLLTPIFMCFAFASNFTYAFIGAALRNWLLVGVRLRVFNALLSLALVLTAFWMLRL
jgi:threonine/homoserine/homoserine lactone efflux protein